MIRKWYHVERYNSIKREWVRILSTGEYSQAWGKYNAMLVGLSGLGGDTDSRLYPEGFVRINVFGGEREDRGILVSYH